MYKVMVSVSIGGVTRMYKHGILGEKRKKIDNS